MGLKLRKVRLRFGGIMALQDVDLQVERGTIHGIIGPNGAGKSTLFNVISGLYAPQSGEIAFEGRSLMGLSAIEIARLGIIRTFQNIRLLPELSVWENMRVSSAYSQAGLFWSTFFHGKKGRLRIKQLNERIETGLKDLGLWPHQKRPAADLAYGEQRKLELARALLQRPKILLLDEPAAGLNPTEKAALAAFLSKALFKSVETIVLIEHDMRFVQTLCTQLTVFDQGKVIGQGSPAQMQRDPRVMEAYMGRTLTGVA